jgi:hypothetical protein
VIAMTNQQIADRLLAAYQSCRDIPAETRVEAAEALMARAFLPGPVTEHELDITLSQVASEMAQ